MYRKKWLIVLVITLLAASVSLGKAVGLSHPVNMDAMDNYWTTEVVDGAANSNLSIALDALQHPHIAYPDSSLHLGHSWYDGVDWHTEIVDTLNTVDVSLALDANGYPHISYCYFGVNWELKYAQFDGATWNIEVVDSAGNVGLHSSLALDKQGHPHISYYDYTNGDLKYTWHDGSSWHTETVDSTGYVGKYTSLIIDATDYPHISYTGGSPSHYLKYAQYDGNDWLIEIVDTGPGKGTSLIIDDNGYPRISYEHDDRLKYARYDGTTWHLETIDWSLGAGVDSSLALDVMGHPHISYSLEASICDVKYAWHDGASWNIETVETNLGWPRAYTSLALDIADHPYIGYYNKGEDSLKCAQRTLEFPAWGIVPPSGEEISSRSGDVTLSFSSGTLTDTVVFTYTPQLPSSVGGSLAGIDHFFDVTAVYSGTGQAAQPALNQTYSVTVQYTDGEIGTAIEDTLALYCWDGGQWVKETSSAVDTATNTVTATPNHFSLWAVLGEMRRVFLPVVLRNY